MLEKFGLYFEVHTHYQDLFEFYVLICFPQIVILLPFALNAIIMVRIPTN